jgi:hypothetical protein
MHYGHDDSGSIEVDETYLGGKEEGLRGRKYRLSHIKFHCVIGRRRITIQPSPSSLVQFNM